MASLERPREVDIGQIADPRQAALERLAALLGGHGYDAQVSEGFLTASAGKDARPLRVWCHQRQSDGGRLWFTWSGATPICEADKPIEALVAVKGVLRRAGT